MNDKSHDKYRDKYRALVASMPPGLHRAILRVMEAHFGEDNAITKPDLIKALNSLGFGKDRKYADFERQVRDAIADIDADETNDIMIYGSSSSGGYFNVTSMDEYERASAPELSREARIRERNQAMRMKAQRVFPPQRSLFV